MGKFIARRVGTCSCDQVFMVLQMERDQLISQD